MLMPWLPTTRNAFKHIWTTSACVKLERKTITWYGVACCWNIHFDYTIFSYSESPILSDQKIKIKNRMFIHVDTVVFKVCVISTAESSVSLKIYFGEIFDQIPLPFTVEWRYNGVQYTFSSTFSCDFQPLTVISYDLRVISNVFVKSSQEKHCGSNRINHGHPCGMEFTLMSLYSTEITQYCSWFLEYKLTRVNSCSAQAQGGV